MPYVDRTVFTSNDQSSGEVADPNLLESNDKHVADVVDANYSELMDFVNSENISQMGIVNIKDYGAIGDGTTDDGSSIQKALNSGESLIFFPEGHYYVDDCGNGTNSDGYLGLRIPSNTTLLLFNDTILQKGGNNELAKNNDPTNGNENINIIGGTLKHVSGAADDWAPTRNGIVFDNVKNSIIKKCSFDNFGNKGVLISNNSSNIRIINNHFTNIFDTAITTSLGTVEIIIKENKLIDLGGDGILIKGNNSVISNNIIKNVGSYSTPNGSAIATGTDNDYCEFNIISSNVIENSSNFGIINDGCKKATITNNIITNCLNNYSIKIGFESSFSVISDNTFNVVSGGLLLDGSDCIIQGNQMEDIRDYPAIMVKIKNQVISDNRIGNVDSNGIEIHDSNVNISNCQLSKISNDVIRVMGALNRVSISNSYFSSDGSGFTVKIDGDSTNYPQYVVVTNCVGNNTGTISGSKVFYGDYIIFKNNFDSLNVGGGAGANIINSDNL